MAKNNHKYADLSINLDELFSSQFAGQDESDDSNLEKYLGIAATYAGLEACISVLSDLKERRSYIFYGGLAETLGISAEGATQVLDTIWEEVILCRISKKDLDRKQMEEMKFFTFVKGHPVNGNDFYMNSSFPMACRNGKSVNVRHRIFYLHNGKTIRYALCLYNASASMLPESTIVNLRSGDELPLYRVDASHMLSAREIEVLKLIADGLSSKEISERLRISVYTVSRHRQNIISEMNVKNSSQACQIAHQMGLI